MYTELSLKEKAEGKTVQSITYSSFADQMVIAFADGTFIAFGAGCGYDNDAEIYRQAIDLEDFGRDALVKSGIITQEELQLKIEEINKGRLQAITIAERRRYEQLKEKFGKEKTE